MATWDSANVQYTTADGRTLNHRDLLPMVDSSIQSAALRANALSSDLSSGLITSTAWRDGMRRQIKDEVIRMYMLGRGGREQMTEADWGSTGGMIADQYRFLERFFNELPTLSPGQIAQRSEMYLRSAREAFNRAKVRAFGLNVQALPAYPGDGSTICLTNCGCDWHLIPFDNGTVLAYWRLGKEENCETCLARASAWNPLTLERSV